MAPRFEPQTRATTGNCPDPIGQLVNMGWPPAFPPAPRRFRGIRGNLGGFKEMLLNVL